jgi:hypothetical protein
MYSPDKLSCFSATPWGNRAAFLDDKLDLLGYFDTWEELILWMLSDLCIPEKDYSPRER